jgi:16S rRNA (uracil1498-N3)-methyltransferase
MSSYRVDPNTVDMSARSALIAGDEAHHAIRVLRVRAGDAVTLIDGAGIGYRAIVDSIRDESVVCSVTRCIPGMGEPAIEVTVAAGILKGDRFELLIEKAVELGAHRIVPFECANTVVRAPSANRQRRWQAVSLAAAKQCLRSRVPEVAAPVTVQEIADLAWSCDAAFVAWEQESGAQMPAAFGAGTSVLVVTGPEGGLTPSEVELLHDAGVQPVTLGARRLRGETAAITALTLVLNGAGEFSRPAYGAPGPSGA